MGRTYVDVEIENNNDVVLREFGHNGRTRVRKDKVRAIVDTGSALLCLHKTTIRKLGLHFSGYTKVRTANGFVERALYDLTRITILGRHCFAQVMEIPDSVPPLIGYIALEQLDLVVDAKSNKVTTNPESGGEYILDLL